LSNDNFNSILWNPHFNPKPPTKAQERLAQKLQDYNQSAAEFNEAKKKESKHFQNTDSMIKLLCPMCSGEVKRKKNKTKTIPCGATTLNVPVYSCIVCKSKFQGYLPNITHESKQDILVDIVEWETVNP
jgi:hypothetical protein